MKDEFIMMPVPHSMFTAVCALIGSASVPAVASTAVAVAEIPKALTSAATAEPISASPTVDAAEPASPSDGTVDADGWPFDESMHTGTLTKAGLWRMKAGVARPNPKPDFPKSDGAPDTGAASSASPSAEVAPAAAQTDAGSDEDEFAAFRAAAAKSDAEDDAAKASVPARKWTDADLGALCNQAASKLGDPVPIKAIIAEYVPVGEVAHSRNIPADKRAEFAKSVEVKAGIEFAS